MKIGIAADHAGLKIKREVVDFLTKAGYQVQDFGAYHFDEEDDYPDIVLPLAQAISEGSVDKGVAICGSGIGVSVVANKLPGVRAAVVSDTYSARLGVQHDGLNLLCLGGRVIGHALVLELTQAFLTASISDEERFQRRIHKLASIEEAYLKS